MPEQAKTVRLIYRLFLEGETPTGIARILTKQGIPTPGGKTVWQNTSVESILVNEKYKGDALLQKKFTVDFLTKEQKLNEGEVPQYYVENSHESIISPQVFDLTHYEIQRRKQLPAKYNSINLFSSRIFCGECGGIYGSKVWHSTDKYRRTVWQCNNRYRNHGKEGMGCSTPHLTEDQIKQAFLSAFNRCIKNREEIIENCKIAIDAVMDTSKLESKAQTLRLECDEASDLIRKCVEENAHIAVNPNLYSEKYEALVKRYTTAKEAMDHIDEELSKRSIRKSQIEFFLDELANTKQIVTEFDNGLWNIVVEKVTVYSEKQIVFEFKGGTKVTWSIFDA